MRNPCFHICCVFLGEGVGESGDEIILINQIAMLLTYSHRRHAYISLHVLQTCLHLLLPPPSPELVSSGVHHAPHHTAKTRGTQEKLRIFTLKPQWINPFFWSKVLGLVSLELLGNYN